MTETGKAINDFLRRYHGDQVAFLAELVRMPSDNPPGDCAAHAEATANLLEGLGYTVERHPVPVDQVRAHGMQSVTNLVIRRRFGEGLTIALNAHGDVVAPGEGWTVDPYGAEIQDGVMYGRGVAVSKSDFATYAFALLALEPLAEHLRGSVELHFTYDEEAGGAIGPAWLLSQGISKPNFAVAAGFSYGVVTHHNGCLHQEVVVDGRSAHAAQPDSGVDALEAATRVLNALYGYRQRLQTRHSRVTGIGTPSLVVGLINGGINTNVVPDRVTLRLDRRLIPEENPDTVETELSSLIGEAVSTCPGASCHIRRIMLARPFVPVGGALDLAGLLSHHACAIFGQEVPSHGVPLYTDARHYAEAGIPTVLYGAGPRTLLEANAHRANERLVLEDLYRATHVVALSLFDLLARDS